MVVPGVSGGCEEKLATRREMTTRVCLVVEVLTRVPRRVWVFRCSLGGLSSLGLGFMLFLCLLVFRLDFHLFSGLVVWVCFLDFVH